MIKPKVGDTLVYKSEADRYGFIDTLGLNASMCKDHYNDGFYVGYIDDEGFIYPSSDAGASIAPYELKYFKIKEREMLKPDDIINVEMTALDAMKILIAQGCCAGGGLYEKFKVQLGVTNEDVRSIGLLFDDCRVWTDNSKLTLAALAQFKNPKQDKIDALEKRINDAAAELAKLKGEQ